MKKVLTLSKKENRVFLVPNKSWPEVSRLLHCINPFTKKPYNVAWLLTNLGFKSKKVKLKDQGINLKSVWFDDRVEQRKSAESEGRGK